MTVQEMAQTIRFFEGLGKALSSWEIDILVRAEQGEEKGEEDGEPTEV